jgi:hypothetical protein
MTQLTDDEVDLLIWLGEEDYSQYGECHGIALDALVELGLAQLHGPETEHNNTFIAKGSGIMFRAVSLTEAGWAKRNLVKQYNKGGEHERADQ